VAGDWTGSGKFGVGVFEPDGTWKLKNQGAGGAPDFVFKYGAPNATPVVGDWNSDGVWTVGVVENNGGVATWKLRNSNSGGAPDIAPFAYGAANIIPVAGAWTAVGSQAQHAALDLGSLPTDALDAALADYVMNHH
jgi:hypothetical protein